MAGEVRRGVVWVWEQRAGEWCGQAVGAERWRGSQAVPYKVNTVRYVLYLLYLDCIRPRSRYVSGVFTVFRSKYSEYGLYQPLVQIRCIRTYHVGCAYLVVLRLM